MNIDEILIKEFSTTKTVVKNIISLIDDGNTVPFIARYRKESTNSMDDQLLRQFLERLTYLRSLKERQEQIVKILTEQGTLTDEILLGLQKTVSLSELEDIYRPFKPKKRTKSTIAQEKGLSPLADIIWEQEINCDISTIATKYINKEKEVSTIEIAISGACDIIAEIISDNPNYRKYARDTSYKEGLITSSLSKKGHEATLEESKDLKNKVDVYSMYFEFLEPLKSIANHRVLALNRGEKEGFLKVDIQVSDDKIIQNLQNKIVKSNKYTRDLINLCINDSYKRLIRPSIEREIRTYITEVASAGSTKIFSQNLRQLLMQSPIKDKNVLAIDPGFRTGCKWAIINEIGNVMDMGIVYCTIGNETTRAKDTLTKAILSHNVHIIAIGNGTACRETEVVVVEMIKERKLSTKYIIVNEAGASVYSASKLAAFEFPTLDVAMRSAISIGRRLQDPLAELVKIDPKSIGIGQYQHDMEQKRLTTALKGVVEDCVNSVGVNLNTASQSLLSYISGISSTLAKNITEHREKEGKFKERKDLLKVSKLGKKAYEQCAGFLRITDGINALDNTGVHPESYEIANSYLKIKDTIKDIDHIAKELSVGVPTLKDIINELQKPGRDPRDDVPPPILRSDILSIDDLQEGMVLKGTVRNIIDFGAFIDIGVHQDGLVHISQMSNMYIKHPLEVISLGDIVEVKILSVDTARNRIALSMK